MAIINGSHNITHQAQIVSASPSARFIRFFHHITHHIITDIHIKTTIHSLHIPNIAYLLNRSTKYGGTTSIHFSNSSTKSVKALVPSSSIAILFIK